MTPILLASGSPRRKQLLEWAEIPFRVHVSNTPEDFPPELTVEEIPVFIARKKAVAVQTETATDEIVLAADTIVVLGEHMLGKPVHREEAISMLLALQGTRHEVITGVVLRQNERELSFFDRTQVDFHPLTETEIEHYVDQYKPYDKAGAYAIQEWIGVVGIRSVEGDFYNVMGLPVSRVVSALKEFSRF
ncbi:MAG: septum formation protein Maf [Bacteroidetes bacterium]|nr:septum formation protein Maf [Bacteroidota bacterium]